MDKTDSHLPNFDDSGLKAAVRRAWGEERCPDDVRARVLAAANASAGLAAPPRQGRDSLPAVIITTRPSFWQQPWLNYGLAAAATVLIGFGVAYRVDDSPFGRDRMGDLGGTAVTFASTVPPMIAQGLRDSHDRCIKYPSHSPSPELSNESFPAIRQRLEQRLRFPVLAGSIEHALGRDGWQFKGAAVCKVGDVDAAHLVFTRGDQAISVFSLPPSSCNHSGREAREYEDPNPDHPVAVFVWSDGVHCVVGSSVDRSVSVDEVRSVLEHLRPSLPQPRGR